MAITHKKNRKVGGSKRNFRKITKKYARNKPSRRTIKKRGGAGEEDEETKRRKNKKIYKSQEKTELLHKLMPERPAESVFRAFRHFDEETLKKMSKEEANQVYEIWRNEVVMSRKENRQKHRANRGTGDETAIQTKKRSHKSSTVKPKKKSRMSSTSQSNVNDIWNFPVHYDENAQDYPLNDLSYAENWQNEIPGRNMNNDNVDYYEDFNDLLDDLQNENENPNQEDDDDDDDDDNDLNIEGIDINEKPSIQQ